MVKTKQWDKEAKALGAAINLFGAYFIKEEVQKFRLFLGTFGKSLFP